MELRRCRRRQRPKVSDLDCDVRCFATFFSSGTEKHA